MTEQRQINEAIAVAIGQALVEVAAGQDLTASARTIFHHLDSSKVFVEVEHRSGVTRYCTVVTVMTDVEP